MSNKINSRVSRAGVNLGSSVVFLLTHYGVHGLSPSKPDDGNHSHCR